MPVVAIGVAAAAWGLGGAAAIGGVIAGTATLATTLTAVATIGATLGAVGAVTHDKTLSTIGTVMGAVGGVGALAANAGIFGEAATTASLFGSDPVPVNVTAPDIAGDVANSNDLSSLAQMPGLPADMATTATDAADSVLPTGAIDTATGAASGDVNSLINGPAPPLPNIAAPQTPDASTPNFDVASNAAPSTTPATSTSTSGPGTISNPSDLGLPTKGSYVGQTSTASDGTSVTWNGTAWAKQSGGVFGNLLNSPMAQYGAIQAAGSFLSGAFDPLKPAQVAALNAQAAANKASAAMTTQQTANMQGSLPVASRVTGVPAPVNGGGLINNTPVTGVAA